MGPPSYMRSVVDRNVVMRRIHVNGSAVSVQNSIHKDIFLFLKKKPYLSLAK